MKFLQNMFEKIDLLQINASRFLSINKRNLLCIYPNNNRKDYPLADDKLKTKELLEAQNIPTPKSYIIYSYFFQLNKLQKDLSKFKEFVIKPAQGRAGGGIVVITGMDGDQWVAINGQRFSSDQLKFHITEIIFGVYSFDMKDHAIIEERIIQHEAINALSPYGLSDIRLIMSNNKAIMAMARLPTVASAGRANIHQGAIGVGIDIDSGLTHHAVHDNHVITDHPDTGNNLIGVQIPYWDQIIDIGIASAVAMPLKYIGADVAITQAGPLIIELNVRPGLAIQAANDASLAERLGIIR